MTYWKDSLLIGVPQIDDQHRKLVSAVDELMEACSAGKGRAAIGKTLEFVISYTKEHFSDEEKLQAKYAYPDMLAHKRRHAQFVSDVTALMDELNKNGPSVSLTGKINKSLVDWLIHHISVEDKKVGTHIQKNTANG